MNTSTHDPHAAEQAVLTEARKVNEERMETVEVLAGLVAERIDLEQRLKENAKQQRQAIREAKKTGWTAAQIKRVIKPPRPAKEALDDQHSDAEIAVL